ncbi:MAG: hypothetical protein GQ477_05555 [Nanohaloarchaea archaeon]|nr:hypothetical protein [Candidatus Nanohaloarchaea archaeon]
MEVKIYFNPAYISINSIAEGNLFTQDGAPTWFMTPIINNTEGSIINIVTSFLGSYNVSKPSNFITINLTAKETLGVSDINLTDIIISYPPDSDALYTFFKNGTITIIDTTAPSSIIGLLNQSKDQDWIYWNWTNPTDSDFSHTEIYINNTWKTNTSNNFYNATELIGDTTYEIQTRTVDNSGNVNTAWVNSSMMTAPDTIAPIITFIAPTNTTALTAGTTQTTINISTDENATCRYNITVTNTSYENSTNFTTTGTTAHSFLYTGLTNGNTYNLYYWCNGTKGNIDQNAAHHTFSVSVALYCGDGTCNNGETCSTCATDCGSCSSSGGSSGGFIPTPIIPEDNTTENITVNNMTQVILQQNTTEDIIKQNDNMDKLEFKITAQDKIEAVKNMIKDIDTVARNILNDAEDAFAKGNYEEAYALASEAEIAIGAGTETSSTPKDHYPILEIIGFVFILMFYILILKKRRTLRRYIKSNINDYIQKRESINN